jgi:homocysteine S-methyltransferase
VSVLQDVNRKGIELLRNLRDEHENEKLKMVISGCMGSRGDGYFPSDRMTVHEAERYHRRQIETFHDTEADMVTAFTLG